MEDLTGKQLGSYQVIAPLGEGGMAAVYKAYQPAMDRYVALKILPRHFASDPQFVSRFQQEARVLARLQHPHILPVFDFGEADGYTYLVMPFIQSGTLAHRMAGSSFPWPQIRAIISQVGDALDYAHAQGLIHRDVKPSNVLIDERGNCLLTDFGLAKIVEGSIHLTTSGAIMGTPAYMSPEQGLGQKLDARSDIYSLGVILYEMATGRTPYTAETPMAIVIKHINDPLPPPHVVNPDLPEAIERVILKALAKNPVDRFATAGEMVRALQAALPETATTMAHPQVPSATTLRSEPTPPVTPPAAPAPRAAAPRSSWGFIVISVIGWVVGVLLGLPFASGFVPLGGLIAGAVGALGMVYAWRRELPLARKRIFALVGIWALMAAIAVVTGLFFFIVLAIAGWLTGMVLQRAEPALTRKHIAMIALGWGLGWLVGGIAFAMATQVPLKPLSGLLVILAIGLAGAIGSGNMLRQFRGAREKSMIAVPPGADRAEKARQNPA